MSGSESHTMGSAQLVKYAIGSRKYLLIYLKLNWISVFRIGWALLYPEIKARLIGISGMETLTWSEKMRLSLAVVIIHYLSSDTFIIELCLITNKLKLLIVLGWTYDPLLTSKHL